MPNTSMNGMVVRLLLMMLTAQFFLPTDLKSKPIHFLMLDHGDITLKQVENGSGGRCLKGGSEMRKLVLKTLQGRDFL